MCICISAYNKAHNKAASCIKTNPLGKVCYKNKKIQAQDSIALAVNKSLPFFDFHKKSKINLVSIWLAVYFSLSQKVHLQSICICKAYFKCLKYCVFFFATFRLLHNSILKVIRLFSVILFYIFIYLVIKKKDITFCKRKFTGSERQLPLYSPRKLFKAPATELQSKSQNINQRYLSFLLSNQ